MDNLTVFRKHTLIKLIIMSLATLLPIIVFITFASIPEIRSEIKADLLPYRWVIIVLTESWIAWKLVIYIRILVSDDFANARLIAKNDERNRHIRLHSNNLTIKLSLYLILVAIGVAAFVDRTVFYTLIGVLVGMLIVYGAVRLYFVKKF